MATRGDGRDQQQLRVVGTALGVLSSPDGSAKFAFENSSVLCSVYGPVDVKLRHELLDSATISVSWSPSSHFSGTKERIYEKTIRETFSASILSALHPRTSIQITIQVLSEDGSILATAINAVSLALIDAGLPLKSVLGSIMCAITDDGDLILDPLDSEIHNSKSTHTFAFDNISGDLIMCESDGLFTEDEYFLCLEACKIAVHSIQVFMKAVFMRAQKDLLSITWVQSHNVNAKMSSARPIFTPPSTQLHPNVDIQQIISSFPSLHPTTSPFHRTSYIITGKPGCGKSTIATKLAQQFGLELITPETVLEKILSSSDESVANVVKELKSGKEISSEVVLRKMEETAVSESCLFTGESATFNPRAKINHYKY
ncbi:Exosome component 5 [Nowakowskiella sp. JEL0407]|nr:Exosome component 5 [Nowakowskiella sp. JEL0407]